MFPNTLVFQPYMSEHTIGRQVELTKQLRQAELDRDEFADRVVELQAQVDDYEQALPVMMSAKSGKRNR